MPAKPIRLAGAVCFVFMTSAAAPAQIEPERLYYGVNGRIEMGVRVPAATDGAATDPRERELSRGPAATPERLEIALLTPEAELERVPVIEGRVDLAALFPRLWSEDKPRVCFAQLLVDGKPAGPAVVLQPMTTPELATPGDPRGMTVRYRPSGKAYYSGLRAYVDRRVVLDTTLGEIEIELRPDAAPNTAWNFRHLVEGGFYTGIAFHRIDGGDAPDRGFVIQAGDPTGTGSGGPGYCIDLERSPLEHELGVVSMARLAAPETGGSQFFICLSRERCRALDGAYAAFGRVVRGIETVMNLARVRVDTEARPLEAPMIRSARLVDAPPRTVEPGRPGGTAPEPGR
ncbi:MAG: peptidylprolyl isomerase [Phycisphaerales bacterium]